MKNSPFKVSIWSKNVKIELKFTLMNSIHPHDVLTVCLFFTDGSFRLVDARSDLNLIRPLNLAIRLT